MLNKLVLQGRLTKDPEMKTTQSGVETLLFTVAWSEKYKETETKCFLLCRAWRHTAKFIGDYFRKGQEIIIEGHMVTETWSDDTQVTHCVVDKAHFAGPRQDGSRQQPKPQPAPPDDFMAVPDDIDEELPFN